MEPVQNQSPLPELPSEDQALLLRLFELGENLTALAAESGRHLLSLFRWHARPDIRAYITHHRIQQAYLQTQTALKALEEIVKTTEDPIEKRRAANAILRSTGAAPDSGTNTQDPGPNTQASLPRGHFLTTKPTVHRSALEDALELIKNLGLDQDQDGYEADDNDPPPSPSSPAPRPQPAADTAPPPTRASEAAAPPPIAPSTPTPGAATTPKWKPSSTAAASQIPTSAIQDAHLPTRPAPMILHTTGPP